jgi:hypothetical protein
VVENHVDCIDINNNTVVVENGYKEVSSASDLGLSNRVRWCLSQLSFVVVLL